MEVYNEKDPVQDEPGMVCNCFQLNGDGVLEEVTYILRWILNFYFPFLDSKTTSVITNPAVKSVKTRLASIRFG